MSFAVKYIMQESFMLISVKQFIYVVVFAFFFLPISANTQDVLSFNQLLMDSILISATSNYQTGKFKKIAYGNQYRKTWRTPIHVPVFNLNTEFSNLEPIKSGGGKATRSLRLEDENGREYVLRSIYKNGRAGVADRFRNTIYEEILQDLRVGAHPYAALVVAKLAEAAEIYHTNPSIYFLPQQKRLGEFNEEYGGELYLFEERPNEGWEELASFGHAEKIIGSNKMVHKNLSSPEHIVNESWVLKCRLFDLLIGDYDRGDDQWRWAAFPNKKNKTIEYRPIPRDRDQAFYHANGVIPWILSRDFIHHQQRPLKGHIQDMKKFASNAKHFDRTWLTGLEWEDWELIARELQSQLTDDVIEEAFKEWPSVIYDLDAPYLIPTLKERRNQLIDHARKLYTFLAKYVDIVGTNKKEVFELNCLGQNHLEVKVYSFRRKRKYKKLIYHRTFNQKETKEIRLYGLGEEDIFYFSNTIPKQLKIRIIGGDDFDRVVYQKPMNRAKNITIYDESKGIELPEEVIDESYLNIDEGVLAYNRFEFQYDRYLPILMLGRTIDDGFFLGGGANFAKYKFQKKPYGAKHHFFLRFATNTDAFHFNYWSDFKEVIGSLDINPRFRFDRPVMFNFYGLGNNSRIRKKEGRYHWIRMERYTVEFLLKKTWKNKYNTTRLGPFFERINVEERADRISNDLELFDANDLGEKNFLGLIFQQEYNSLDNTRLPQKGWKLDFKTMYYRNLNQEQAYARIEGAMSRAIQMKFHIPFNIILRSGAAILTDENYYFFHNNNIGGNNYLRGFHENRFAGTTILYQNIDLRIPLFYFRNHVAPGQIGFFTGLDFGRVWYNQESEGSWKTSLSYGIWWAPYQFTALNIFYSFTGNGENNAFTIRTGFFF